MIIELRRATHIQRMTYEEFERRVIDGEISTDVPVRFEAVTGDAFVPAGELELVAVLINPHRKAFRAQLTRPGIPLITALLVGFQLRIYALSWVPGVEGWLQEGFTNWAPAVLEQGEVFRLLSYGLLHVSFTHLLFNLTFLAYTGYNLERALGRLNLLLLFFGSVFLGGVLSMWMAPERPSLGASGGDFGLLAAAVVFGWKHWDDIPRSARTKFGWALAPYLGFSLISGLTAENVDNWGHLGGLLGGALLMTFLSPELDARRARMNQWVRRVSLGVGVAVSVVFVLWGPALIPLVDRADGNWSVSAPSYWREGWTFTGDRGWFSPTGQATAVINRTVHARPVDVEDATDALIRRVGAGGSGPEVVLRRPVELAGAAGREVVLRFSLADKTQHIRAMILTQGVYTYRVQMQSVEGMSARYSPVFERMLSAARLSEPDALVDARARAELHPRSWATQVALGDALYRVGDATGARAAYERALQQSPGRTDALVGRLRVMADYGLKGGLGAARDALALASDRPKVVVAAADVLYAIGEYDQAIATLDAGWLKRPGSPILRRARLQWALPVD